MKILIAEDDVTSAKILMKMLSGYGRPDIAVNGMQAMEQFSGALKSGAPYDLVCLDIMMPRMDGQEVLRQIRALEESRGITGLRGVKVIMTTALDDFNDIMRSFKEQCEGYLVKPIQKGRLAGEIDRLGFVAAKKPVKRSSRKAVRQQ